ncbi:MULTISPECIES: hypothetical protein [unclassified Acidovorax]|uniref:hypothetical protein n=1 Tax=unclassified Acidovorax TaxID=2684926 RepID=UPI000B3FE4FC|nr:MULTISPECIES: hypothetical protein [unclassified Acidovorax]
MNNECRACGAWSLRAYCQPCVDEDTAQTDAWERRYVERCDREFDDGAYERSQQRKEQRYLENDANWP